MEINNNKNMVVLKNLPSNIVEEAYVVLKSKKKAKKLQKIENNNKESVGEFSGKGNYVVKEAELLVSNYLEKINNNKMILNVKTKKIATTKISGVKKAITLKKGKKYTLKPVLSPITSTGKVTYSSANKKIATVSSKGVIKALKKGKVKITVKSGKKTVTCVVTVK